MGVCRSNPKRPQQRHNSKVNMKIIALAISLASLVHGEGLFLSNALDGVEIKLRGRDRGPDITQVELYIRPNEVAASGQIPTLEYKEEDGCWKEAPAKAGPTKRGQKKEVEARPARSLQDLQVQVRLALPILHRISGTPK